MLRLWFRLAKLLIGNTHVCEQVHKSRDLMLLLFVMVKNYAKFPLKKVMNVLSANCHDKELTHLLKSL